MCELQLIYRKCTKCGRIVGWVRSEFRYCARAIAANRQQCPSSEHGRGITYEDASPSECAWCVAEARRTMTNGVKEEEK